MALNDCRITDADIGEKGVCAAPDKLTGSAAENKAVFDRLIRECVKGNFNALIDYISSMELEALAGNAVRSSGDNAPRWLRIGSNGAIQYSADGTNWNSIFGTAEVGHAHNDLYYTENEVDQLLAGKADAGHDHDKKYYTRTETDALLAKKHEYAPVTEVSAARTLTAEDQGSFLYCTAEVTITVPGGSGDTLPVGAELEIFRAGSGSVTIAAAEGTAFAIPGGSTTTAASRSIAEQYSSAVLKKLAAGVWSIQGALE